MREKADVLLGLPARLKVANRESTMRLTGIVDGMQDQLDGPAQAVSAKQIAFDRMIGVFQQVPTRIFAGKELVELRADDLVGGHSHQLRKAVVDRNDRLTVANQESFDAGICQP